MATRSSGVLRFPDRTCSLEPSEVLYGMPVLVVLMTTCGLMQGRAGVPGAGKLCGLRGSERGGIRSLHRSTHGSGEPVTSGTPP